VATLGSALVLSQGLWVFGVWYGDFIMAFLPAICNDELARLDFCLEAVQVNGNVMHSVAEWSIDPDYF
jgi:hypothetical protein